MSFGRLSQKIVIKNVSHLQHDYFFSFNQSDYCFFRRRRFCRPSLSSVMSDWTVQMNWLQNWLQDWLQNVAPAFQPMKRNRLQNQNESQPSSYAQFFPRLKLCSRCDWGVGIALVILFFSPVVSICT